MPLIITNSMGKIIEEKFLINKIKTDFDPCGDIYKLIENAVADDPPLALRDGDIIKDGYNEKSEHQNNAETCSAICSDTHPCLPNSQPGGWLTFDCLIIYTFAMPRTGISMCLFSMTATIVLHLAHICVGPL